MEAKLRSRIYEDSVDPIYVLCDRLVAGLIYAFAIYTLCYHAGIILKISLKSITIISMVAWIAILFSYLLSKKSRLLITTDNGKHVAWAAFMLAGLFLGCGLLSLLTVIPNADDVDYMARAVHNFEYFSRPVFLEQPFAFVTDDKTALFQVTPSYEHFCASLALIFGVKPIQIVHYLVPFVAGGLVPVVWYLLLRRFTESPVAALAGTLAVVLLLCSDGATLRSFGNFAFVRLWQGKVLLMAIVTPLCVRYLLDAFNDSSISAYIRVAALSVVGIGLSLMAFFYLPLLFAAIAVSYYLVEYRETRFRNIALTGVFLLAYILVWAVPNYWMQKGLIAVHPSELHYPDDLKGIAGLVFGQPPGISGTLAIISLSVLACLRRWRLLSWLIIWTGLILVPISFPWISTAVTKYVTSRDAFWRVLYILPIPLAVGVAGSQLYMRFSSYRKVTGCVAAGLILTVVYLNSFASGMGPWAKDGVLFPVRRLKLPAEVTYSHEIIKTLESGPMLAPLEVSMFLPIFSAQFPQCSYRGFSLDRIFTMIGDRQSASRRLSAHSFVRKETTSDAAFSAFTEEIRHPYRYVILPSELAEVEKNVQALTEAGFVSRGVLGGKFKIFERIPAGVTH